MSQNQDFKLEIQPELIDLVSESESNSDSDNEVEFLPVFGPFLAPYQGPYGNWIFPAGCPNIGWNLPQPASPPQLHDNDEEWSDEYQQNDESEDSVEDEELPEPQVVANDEGYPLQIEDFVEENVGHEVVSESSDSGQNSESDS